MKGAPSATVSVEGACVMNRKRAKIVAALAAGLLLVGGAFWLLQHQPAFYRAALHNPAPPETRREQAKQFVQDAVQLVNGVRNEETWAQEFSDQSVNAWLADELPVKYPKWLPKGVVDPRVRFEQDSLRLAFRTGTGLWSKTISARLKVWVAGPNELALEIESLNAGLVPIPIDDVVSDLIDSLNKEGWRIEWREAHGRDVLVVALGTEPSEGDDPRQAVVESVELDRGRLSVTGGRRTDLAERPATHPSR